MSRERATPPCATCGKGRIEWTAIVAWSWWKPNALACTRAITDTERQFIRDCVGQGLHVSVIAKLLNEQLTNVIVLPLIRRAVRVFPILILAVMAAGCETDSMTAYRKRIEQRRDRAEALCLHHGKLPIYDGWTSEVVECKAP